MPQGPNLKKLICHKMSVIMVPPGAGLGGAITALAKPGNLQAVAKEATEWVMAAIAIVRAAAEPNPWRSADDEAIAGEILVGIEKRKSQQVQARRK